MMYFCSRHKAFISPTWQGFIARRPIWFVQLLKYCVKILRWRLHKNCCMIFTRNLPYTGTNQLQSFLSPFNRLKQSLLTPCKSSFPLLCILNRKQVFNMPFAGWIHLFQHFYTFCHKLEEKKKKYNKEKNIKGGLPSSKYCNSMYVLPTFSRIDWKQANGDYSRSYVCMYLLRSLKLKLL